MNAIKYIGLNTALKVPVLKEIFDRYAEDTITEEQVQRVLAPVLRMIREGRFDKLRKRRFSWRENPVISVIAVLMLVIVVAFTQNIKAADGNMNALSKQVYIEDTVNGD